MPELISTQDHDLLIQLHTKMDTMLLALDTIRVLENSTTRHSEKIKAVDMTMQTEIKHIKDDIQEIKSKSNVLDMISIAFTAIVGTLVYLFKH